MSSFIHPSAEVEPGAIVGDGTRIWRFAHVMSGARIGSRCSLGQGCFVANDAIVGNGCKLQNNVSVYAGVQLGDDVFVGPSAVFTNVSRPRAAFPRPPSRWETTWVDRGATIGANATIVCGRRIGRCAFVAAGAVVASDVPAHALVMGTPARLKAWICACGETIANGAPVPLRARCSACERCYEPDDQGGLRDVAG